MAVTGIARVSLTSADIDRLAAFYRDAFGFVPIRRDRYGGAGFARLVGIAGAEAQALLLRLGGQMIKLLAFSPPGEPYPAESGSDDLRFQHIAIVVSNMRASHARLCECKGWQPITRPEPQRLPASSGGVTAFKFRDPEGHPLELLAFPPDRVPPSWQEASRQHGPCLGIDHSAIVVANTARSIVFYERFLGFSVTARSLNRGPEQDRLDGLSQTVVDVTALAAGSPEPPHLELLGYRSAARSDAAAPALPSNNVAATQLVFDLDNMPDLIEKLAAARVPFISPGAVALADGKTAALIRDPDGHALLLLGQ